MAKKLNDILKHIKPEAVTGDLSIKINNLVFDSRQVSGGDLFVAVRGTQTDGHKFIQSAIEQGASSVICEEMPSPVPENLTLIRVKNSSRALGLAASAFYDDPGKEIKVVGVTGTNGKTTTVFLLYQLYRKLGYQAGLLSTIENRIGDERIKATHTTADAIHVNKNLKKMVDAGCEYCFMEISSHAIYQNRVAGIHLHGAVFTNITHDHLDYHQSFDRYIKAKKKLFDELPSDAFALANADDSHAMVMLQNSKAKKATYSIRNVADYKGKILENRFEGLQMYIEGKEIYSRLVGYFNAYNLMAAYAVAIIDGQERDEALLALSGLQPVEGRFEVVPSSGGIIGIVDYAHTPDALQNVLETINAGRSGPEHLLTIIGAGGDRDREKRPLLAQIACRLSDRVILTSDNPRSEDPEKIIAEMEAGLDSDMRRKTVKIANRKEAIKTACMISVKGDIILVAGKGHETYQEIKGVKQHFDDREILSEFLND